MSISSHTVADAELPRHLRPQTSEMQSAAAALPRLHITGPAMKSGDVALNYHGARIVVRVKAGDSAESVARAINAKAGVAIAVADAPAICPALETAR